MSERNEKGQYEKGVTGNPNGRPPKAREAAYLAVLRETITIDDWKQVVLQAKTDALSGEDGKTREFGRRFLADYCIGKPQQSISIERGSGINEFADVSDAELDAIIAADDAKRRAGEGDPGSEESGAG